MALTIGMIHIRVVHLMRGFRVLFHVHAAEPSLQGLGCDRQNKDDGPKFHHEKIYEFLV